MFIGPFSFLGPPGPAAILARSTVENIQSWRFYKLDNATFTTKFIYQLETKKPLDPLNPKVELQLPLLVSSYVNSVDTGRKTIRAYPGMVRMGKIALYIIKLMMSFKFIA
jgi:hypothetical protein